MKHKGLFLLSNLLCSMCSKRLSGIIVAHSVKINKKISRSFVSVTLAHQNEVMFYEISLSRLTTFGTKQTYNPLAPGIKW
jgi:hypothetical protein